MLDRVLVAVVLVAGLTHVLALTLWPGAPPADHVLLTTVSDFLGATSAVVLLVRRGLRDRLERAVWLLLAAGVSCYLVATILFALLDVGLLPPPLIDVAYAGWSAFYLLVYLTLVALLRRRVTRFLPSMWLDGLVTGLAVAGVVLAFLVGPFVAATGGGTAALVRGLAYPVSDALLVAFLVGVLSVLRGRGGPAVWALSAGLVIFAATDAAFAVQSARGTYVDGGPLDLGYVVAQSFLAVATCLRPGRGRRAWDGLAVLAVPAAGTVAALALLAAATVTEVTPAASWLALLAVTAALVRTGLTFREVRALGQSRREARTDDLTGLPNRRHFYEALTTAASPGGSLRPVVVLVDLDRFKDINDSLGHSAGDQLLQLVAARLSAALPEEGDVLLARLGGDEFALLTTSAESAPGTALAGRLQESLAAPFALRGIPLAVEASIGVASPAAAVSGEDVLQMADIAMYAAKSRRTGVHVYDERHDGPDRHRLELVTQLRAGLEDQLVLHYQPKVELRTGRVTGVEALVRWQHPQHGLLYPDRFIELAETAGLMNRLTLVVLEQALAQVVRWREEDGIRLQVAVNVSPWNLADPGFPDEVAAALARSGVGAGAVVLEVTETSLMQDREQASCVLTRLRDAGIAIAVDDYGTGYSSLAYLTDLPLDELKLDRRFAARLADPRTAAVVASTVQLAHALGLDLVVEGVEDEEAYGVLVGQGCDLAQGYHLSRPVPAADLPEVARALERLAPAAGAGAGRLMTPGAAPP